MIVINAYKYVGEHNKIRTMMYRYAVISQVYGAAIPADVEVKRLSPQTVKLICGAEHRETADRLLFLFGAGVIDEDTVLNLIKTLKADYLEDISAAEKKVTDYELSEDNTEDRLSYPDIQNILLCAANSKRNPALQPVSFDEAVSLAGLRHIAFVDGMVKVTDYEYFKLLVELGEKFANIKDETIRFEDNPDNLINNEDVKNGDIKSVYYPFAVNPLRLIHYSAVWDKLYGMDFIKYAKENSIPVDGDFSKRYEEYVRKIKLHFTVRSYDRKRHICGDSVNWFDYAAVIGGIISKTLTADREKPVDLDVNENYPDTELVQKAVEKFKGIYQPLERTVIEVFHGSERYLYVYKNNEFCPINDTDFHRLLFDFDKIWSIIQKCSRGHKIKMVNDRIVIPTDLWNEIAPEQREYADRLIKEQYLLMKEQRKSNKLLQTLGELKKTAAEERAKIDGANAAKDEKQKAIAEKNANRKASTEDKK